MTTHDMIGAAQAGLVSCTTCGLLSRPAQPATPGYCPRCGERLVWRRHNSIQYTWALVIAAAICYVPANVLPVLRTWPLALIVLVASVMIPIGKLVALAYLLITVQRGSKVKSHERTRLYYVIEFIGRWSMLDVFVDAFIVALVQLSPLMSVEPGLGVVFFMAVVILTMLAAQTFEPRLIWDAGTDRQVSHG